MIHTPTHQCVHLEETKDRLSVLFRSKPGMRNVMEITLDVVMEENSLEEKTSLSTQVGAPDPAAWVSPPTGGGTCSGPTPVMDSTITTETNQVIGLFTCLRGCSRASDGTDGTCLLTSW